MDEVFRALADPQRRLLLDRLNVRGGQTLRELCAGLSSTRQAVSKHLAVLEAANLVTTVRRGREKWHYLNAAPITEIADRWISRYDRARTTALADLKAALETTVNRPSFVHTSYIRTTPQRLWAALTEPAFTRRYWQSAFDTDWTPGAPMTWHIGSRPIATAGSGSPRASAGSIAADPGTAVSDPGQVVLEADPPRRLSYTWHTFTPEWAAAVGVAEEVRAKIAAERRSRVTFELEPDGPLVKLTVVHDEFDEGSRVVQMVSGGWPRVVAELKTLLEAGGPDGDGFSTAVAVAAPVERVIAALTTVEGIADWWSVDVTGSPAPGGELTVRFGGQAKVLRVEHVDQNEAGGLVVWTCLSDDNHDNEWAGTSMWFDVRAQAGGGSVLAFRHVGLTTDRECFGVCRPGWEFLLPGLVRTAEGTGGTPWGSAAFDAEWQAAMAGA